MNSLGILFITVATLERIYRQTMGKRVKEERSEEEISLVKQKRLTATKPTARNKGLLEISRDFHFV